MDNVNRRIELQYNNPNDDEFLYLHYLQNQRRECYSYRDLLRQAWNWTVAYRQRGLKPGDSVVIILRHSIDLYSSFCGALLGGFIPAYFAFPSVKLSKQDYFSSINQLIDSSRAKLVVTYDELKFDLLEVTQNKFKGSIIASSEIEIDYFAEVGQIYYPKSQDTAFLQFSSGTTGIKKGVAISHQSLLTQIDGYGYAIDLDPEQDVIVSWLPLYHDMGLIACCLLPLITRTPLVCLSPFEWVKNPSSLLHLISEYKGTLCWLPNFSYNLLANTVRIEEIKKIDLSTMRGFINCSEPVLDSSHKLFFSKFKGCGLKASALTSCYAMAENTFAMTSPKLGESVAVDTVDAQVLANDHKALAIDKNNEAKTQLRHNVSCGKPVAGTEIVILDEANQFLQERMVGQIALRGPCCFSEYFNNPEATRRAFYRDFFLTGDLGYMAEGELYVIGRCKDTIIINGKNIYPQDIEYLVNEVEGVVAGRSAALGVSSDSLGSDQLVVIAESMCLLEQDKNRVAQEIYQKIVSSFEIQAADICIVPHQWLKKSTSGKISRKINRRRYLEELCRSVKPLAESPFQQPSLSQQITFCVQQIVAQKSAFPLRQLNEHSSLMNSGIVDSLSLASLLALIEDTLDIKLPRRFAADINEIDTIALIVGKITELDRQGIERENESEDRTVRWHKEISKTLLKEDDDSKYQLVPQLKISDHLPTLTHPQLGRICRANFCSESLNTDENGCRVYDDGTSKISFSEFCQGNKAKSVVIGNSAAFGVGVSADQYIFSNQLNQIYGDGFCCYNLCLRASVMAQELKVLQLFNPGHCDNIIWFSGLNNLAMPLLQFAQELAKAVLQQNTSRVAYKRDHWPKLYSDNILAPICQQFADLKNRSKNTKVIFCLQPILSWIDKKLSAQENELVHIFDCSFDMPLRQVIGVAIQPGYQQYRNDLHALCQQYQFEFFDFNQDSFFANDQWLFVDRVHLTDKAHHHIAQTLQQAGVLN